MWNEIWGARREVGEGPKEGGEGKGLTYILRKGMREKTGKTEKNKSEE